MEPLILPGQPESLAAIGRYIMEAAAAAGLDHHAAYKLRLAVDELATNVVIHGYQEAALTGDVRVSAGMDDAALTIAIEDTARPFDPTAQALPAVEELDLPLDERPIGGLGVLLARESVDNLRYEYSNGRNCTIITVNRPPRTVTG